MLLQTHFLLKSYRIFLHCFLGCELLFTEKEQRLHTATENQAFSFLDWLSFMYPKSTHPPYLFYDHRIPLSWNEWLRVLKFKFIFMLCVWVNACMCLCNMCMHYPWRGQKRALFPLKSIPFYFSIYEYLENSLSVSCCAGNYSIVFSISSDSKV